MLPAKVLITNLYAEICKAKLRHVLQVEILSLIFRDESSRIRGILLKSVIVFYIYPWETEKSMCGFTCFAHADNMCEAKQQQKGENEK